MDKGGKSKVSSETVVDNVPNRKKSRDFVFPVSLTTIGQTSGVGKTRLNAAFKLFTDRKTKFLLDEEDKARASVGREPLFNKMFAEGLTPYLVMAFGTGMVAGGLHSYVTKGRLHTKSMYVTGLCTTLISLLPF